VTLANNGAEAVALCALDTFDLILLDIQMTEMNGYGATTAIREIERNTGAHIPIIAMTAHAMIGDQDRCLAGLLSKPIHLEELLQKMQQFSPRSTPSPVTQLTWASSARATQIIGRALACGSWEP